MTTVADRLRPTLQCTKTRPLVSLNKFSELDVNFDTLRPYPMNVLRGRIKEFNYRKLDVVIRLETGVIEGIRKILSTLFCAVENVRNLVF
mmetsp:Transcript_14508/g.27508  ORF Transcript_14508/g.27508 Transcript_14508/m.27508 type:complete len:90 (+) Transcript_14508:289-558(+)